MGRQRMTQSERGVRIAAVETMLIFAAGRREILVFTATIAEPKATHSRAPSSTSVRRGKGTERCYNCSNKSLKLCVDIRDCCRDPTISGTDVILNPFVLHAKDERYYIEFNRIGCGQFAISALHRVECVLCGRRNYRGC